MSVNKAIKLNEADTYSDPPTKQNPGRLLCFDQDKVEGVDTDLCDGEEFSKLHSFEQISIAFTSEVSMHGIYILANNNDGPPYLDIKFTHSNGKQPTTATYEFESTGTLQSSYYSGRKNYYSPSSNIWHYLPVDLSVVKCEITARGKWRDPSPKTNIEKMFFVREETPKELEFHGMSGTNEDERAHSRSSDVTCSLQKMLKGEGSCKFTHLSLPFSPTVAEMKGAYICIDNLTSPSIIFIFTHSDLVQCEIIGNLCNADSGIFRGYSSISGLFFVREESFREKVNREAISSYSSIITIKSSSGVGTKRYPPIPYSDPTIIPLPIDEISGCDDHWGKQSMYYDKSEDIQGILRGDQDCSRFSHLYFPFSSPISHLKGIHICCDKHFGPISLLLLFDHSDKYKISSMKFSLPQPKNRSEWIFLPIDLTNVVHCEIRPEGTWDARTSRRSYIDGLIFVRAETPKELQDRKDREKFISSAPSISSTIFNRKDRLHPPVALDSPQTLPLNIAESNAYDDSFCKESVQYDKSSIVRGMLRGECCASFSHLSIPFQDKCCPKGVYICFKQNKRIPAFRFVFTHSDGKQTFMKCAVEDLEYKYEWHFFPMDLSDVVLCEIEREWIQDINVSLHFEGILFVEEPLPSPSPSPLLESGEEYLESIRPLILDSSISSRAFSSKSRSKKSGANMSLPAGSTITPQCIIGVGGFGEVILVRVDFKDSTPPLQCALKCIKNQQVSDDNKRFIDMFKKEFSRQCRLYLSGSLKTCVPRPLYTLDLLDGDLKGTFGILMEFCRGGSVIDFAKSWALDLNECDPSEDDDDDLVYDPTKIAALSVDIIECMSNLFKAKKKLIHRDIKPENFLVRFTSPDEYCKVVLGDLGFVEIHDSMSRQSSFQTLRSDDSSSSETPKDGSDPHGRSHRCIVGTLCYNAPESLQHGRYSQASDTWGCILTIWSLFNNMEQPFMSHPQVTCIDPSDEDYNMKLIAALRHLMATKDTLPRLDDSELFLELKTMCDGKFKPVYDNLLAVFEGIMEPDKSERMTIHDARKLTDEIKHFLPRVGGEWECPSIDEYIHRQLVEYEGRTGSDFIKGSMEE
ncbi:hypothetical protein ADUPG1_009004 [Aduncisulcus paluster]|uniref:Protein kinase domain-containing protein n=1 Tax=Aduncisulcus paluster TaxID=2918883 RepID=A0ABQ5KU05_9EUKA|nr:hypothetical protein ADUPG1_009004 [Aduncisulcus paluster]